MIPKECKRLAEVDFPIAEVSKHATAEKESRRGHIPRVHIWPAARPTASSRAVLMTLLLPDPCDVHCPREFKDQAREILREVRQPPKSDEDLQKTLLWFIGSFANWDMSSNAVYLKVARNLVRAAHPEESPLVGATLGEAHLRASTGALVLSMRNPDGSFTTNPASDTALSDGQILIAIGTEAQLDSLRRASNGGAVAS